MIQEVKWFLGVVGVTLLACASLTVFATGLEALLKLFV